MYVKPEYKISPRPSPPGPKDNEREGEGDLSFHNIKPVKRKGK